MSNVPFDPFCGFRWLRCSDTAGRGNKKPLPTRKIANSGTAFAAVPPGFHAEKHGSRADWPGRNGSRASGTTVVHPGGLLARDGERRKRTAGQRRRAGLQPMTGTLSGRTYLSALFLKAFEGGSARKPAPSRIFDPIHYSTILPAVQEENGKNCRKSMICGPKPCRKTGFRMKNVRTGYLPGSRDTGMNRGALLRTCGADVNRAEPVFSDGKDIDSGVAAAKKCQGT